MFSVATEGDKRSVEREVIVVREDLDVFELRKVTRAFAARLGFGPVGCGELAIVVSELGTNILKYGRRGKVTLEVVRDSARGVGLRIISEDEGPGIDDFEMALRDGHETSGPIDPAKFLSRAGIGSGLGAVLRLSDDLLYENTTERKRLLVTRYVRTTRRAASCAD
jgi:anti-sigma regulatory factor (Ser/Thr protein kinase)